MTTNLPRREFLTTSGAMLAGAALCGLGGPAARAAEKTRSSSPAAAALGWLVGAQLYTFRRFSFYEALDMIAELGILHVEPCFFLRLDKDHPDLKTNEDLSADARKELRTRLADRGVAMSAFYSNVGDDRDADRAKRVFDFCKEMGAGTIVAEPPAEAIDMIETLCDEYKIDLAIHNHPGPSKYWQPENVLAVCEGRGKRIGACCDTGHWVRSGLEPVECLKKLEGRILGFHLKNAAEKGNPKSRDMPLGEGAADYAAVLAELKRQGYQGVMTIEYEHDSPELLADVAKCVAFVEKTAKGLSG